MRLERYLDHTLVFAGLRADDKESLLRQLAELAAQHLPAVDAAELLRALRAREADGSTGIGSGVAVPHGTMDGLERSTCVLAQIPEGVDFGSVDGSPVYFAFLLLSPPQAVGTHLRLLARIARLVHARGFVEAVRSASSPAEIHQLVVREDERHVD